MSITLASASQLARVRPEARSFALRTVQFPSTHAIELPGFFVGGFECSSHRLRDGRRLNLLGSTQHVRFADADYDRLVAARILCTREGLSWSSIDRIDARYDFTTVLPILRAARRTGVRVIWDLMHFGWPDDLDVFAPEFVTRFARLARAFADLLAAESDEVPWICPVNEMSFLAWAGGDVAAFNPFATGRGFELKCQLVRAALAASDAIRVVHPAVRIVVHEPAFHVIAQRNDPVDLQIVEATRQTQFQAVDLMLGRLWPQLGGREDAIDLIGVNYYPWNQWTFGTPSFPSELVSNTDSRYRPLGAILCEWHERYRRPVYLGETGCEGDARAPWLGYACDEVTRARDLGAQVEGVCLYPIVNFPGWDDDRHCQNGLWDYADTDGSRPVDAPLARELAWQQRLRVIATSFPEDA